MGLTCAYPLIVVCSVCGKEKVQTKYSRRCLLKKKYFCKSCSGLIKLQTDNAKKKNKKKKVVYTNKADITLFDGKYSFLSNFYPVKIVLDGLYYLSVEHAYQAAKTDIRSERDIIIACKTPAQAKKIGKLVTISPYWEERKIDVMHALLTQKFSNPELKEWLLSTGTGFIVEGNKCHDNFWGSCSCTECNNMGYNYLGKILMSMRDVLKGGKK